MKNSLLKITQIRSSIGCFRKHKFTLICLGLKGINTVVYKKNISSVKGMIKKVFYLIKVQENLYEIK